MNYQLFLKSWPPTNRRPWGDHFNDVVKMVFYYRLLGSLSFELLSFSYKLASTNRRPVAVGFDHFNGLVEMIVLWLA